MLQISSDNTKVASEINTTRTLINNYKKFKKQRNYGNQL